MPRPAKPPTTPYTSQLPDVNNPATWRDLTPLFWNWTTGPGYQNLVDTLNFVDGGMDYLDGALAGSETLIDAVAEIQADYFRRDNILGAVSQSGGVPTGAIIQQGGNSNGKFVRFADGTQICTISTITSSTSTDKTWVFPAAFTYPAIPERPAVVGSVATTFGNAWRLIFGGIASGTDIAFNVVNTSNARVAAQCSLMAVGRWF